MNTTATRTLQCPACGNTLVHGKSVFRGETWYSLRCVNARCPSDVARDGMSRASAFVSGLHDVLAEMRTKMEEELRRRVFW